MCTPNLLSTLSVDATLFTSLRTESCSRYCLLRNPSSVDAFGCTQSYMLTFVIMKGALLCESLV